MPVNIAKKIKTPVSYFKNICLADAPQHYAVPIPVAVSDLTEICYLAAMVEEEVDSVAIPCHPYDPDLYRNFSAHLKARPANLVGISSMTGAFNNALRLAEIAKKSGAFVVMGGYHPSALPRDTLKSPWIDAVIIGEGENTFRELVINGPGKEIQGLAYKDNGSVVITEPRPLNRDLDSFPHPARHLRPVRFGEAGSAYSFDTIYTSRGCPRTCTFCANDTVHKRWRGRSPENVLEELGSLHNPKRKKFLKIWDANFLLKLKRAERICDLMIEGGLTHFVLWTEASVGDIIRAEPIMDKLYGVGLRAVNLGIESPNAETLRQMNKKQTTNDAAKAVGILKNHGIEPNGYFIIGHHHESVEDTRAYPAFASELGIRNAVIMVMTPYPGTVIFNEYASQKRIASFDWDMYNNFCPVVETDGMDTATLKKMYAWCYGNFYCTVHLTKILNFGLFRMIFNIVSYLVAAYVIFRLNKTSREEDIKMFIFEMLLAAVGTKHDRKKTEKNLWMRWAKKITVRVLHSPGRGVDFKMTERKDRRAMFIESFDENTPADFVIKLDRIIRMGKALYPGRLVTLFYKWYTVENLSEKNLRNILPLFTRKDFLIAYLHLLCAVSAVISKGVVFAAAAPFVTVFAKR
jgi:magnesium-protoporphyrin IX monomethyl ester (oxidative) cyclase